VKVSFVVHAYNEAEALRRLVRSSLPIADCLAEWVVVDHRSHDDTVAACDELARDLAPHGIPLRYLFEGRDFSAGFTFADLRQATVKAATSEIVVLHDADFILGRGYRSLLHAGLAKLTATGSKFYGCGYNIPVIWSHLTTDATGVIVEHGPVWLHGRPPRILHREAIAYQQIGNEGMWEQASSTDVRRIKRAHLTRRRPALAPEALVSVNAKPAERRALRHTMCTFHRDVLAGRLHGEWLENYRAGTLEAKEPYVFSEISLRGWQLHAPGLEVVA